MKKTHFLYTVIFLLYVQLATAQQTIRGQVLNGQTTEPVPGATVNAINSGGFKQTNNEGRFVIAISRLPDTIVITHSGFQRFILPINTSADSVLIMLEQDVSQLSEVVVQTGYQSIPKERLTGSYYQLDSAILNQQVTMNIMDRLDGITGSLLVDNRGVDGPRYQVRGLSTLTDQIQSPLIILDNFPYEGDIRNINPNDVENITVLRDAAAASIWGARAGNGVIVITTRKAAKRQPVKITFNHNTTVTSRPGILTAPAISSAHQVQLEQYLFENGYYDWRFSDPWQTPVPQAAEILQLQKNGLITATEAQERLARLSNNDVRKDVYDYLYRSGINNQAAISVSGSAEKISYLLSAGYDKDISTLRGNANNRFTLRSDNTIDLTRNWVLQAAIIYTRSHNTDNSPGPYGSYSYGTGSSMSPYDRLADENGNPLPLNLFYRGVFTDTAGGGRLLDWKYRPLQQLAVNDNNSRLSDILINIGSNYRLTKWLSLDARYQYQQYHQQLTRNNTLENYFARDMVNMFSQVQNNVVKYIVPLGGTRYTVEDQKQAQSARGQLNVNKTWNGIHELTAIAGAEIRAAVTNYKAGTIYGINEHTLTTQPVDHTTQYPVYAGLRSNSFIPDGINLNRYNSRFVSVYSNASYTFDKRYTIYGSVRRDASNLFGVRTNQKWVPLWSAGGLWNISGEKFYHSSLLPHLAFRLSYGMSGNLDLTTSALMRINFVSATGTVNQLPSVSIAYPQNEDLRWERVKTMNLGIDFGTRNQRLTGSVECYRKHSIDLVSPVTTDPTLGYTNVRMNAASIKGNGWDIVLNSKNIDRVFKWQTMFLFSYVNYRVEKYGQAVSEEGLITSGTLFPIEGYNPYAIVAFKWAGLDPQTGDPLGYLDGEISKDYRALTTANFRNNAIYRSALAPYFGSLRNTLQYKNLSLAFNIVYKAGHHYLRPALNYSRLYDFGTGSYEYTNRWQAPGDENITNVPSRVYPANAMRDNFYTRSSVNVLNASHVRLRDAFAAYDFPHFNNKIIKGAQFYIAANDINWLLWKAEKDGPDPELLYNPRPGVKLSAGIKLNF